MSKKTGESEHQLGGCICGAIRYQLLGAPLFTHACHCTDCQKLTGSAFGITCVFDELDFELLQGEPEVLRTTGGSGAAKTLFRCGNCGASLYNTTGVRPGTIVVRPGSLDDSTWVNPQAHIYVRSKQSWVELPAHVPSFDIHYEVSELWPGESLRRLEAIRQRNIHHD